MKTVQQIMQETNAQANIQNFRYMQEHYSYDQKVRHAQNVAASFEEQCPPPGLTRQLQRLVTEERPGACVGCGFEHNCRERGCAVLRKISRIVAVIGR